MKNKGILQIKGVTAEVGDIIRLKLKGKIFPNYTGILICIDQNSVEFVDANALAFEERQHIKIDKIKKIIIRRRAHKAIPTESDDKNFEQGQTVTTNNSEEEEDEKTGRVVAALHKIVFVEISPGILIHGKAKHFD